MKLILTRLYQAGRLDDAGLDAAVVRGWITEADATDIRGA